MTEWTTFADVQAFGADPFGGEGEVLSHGPDYVLWARMNADGSTTLCTQQFVDPILEANAIARSESEGKRWGDIQRIASVPNVFLYGDGYYAKARAAGDKPAMMKWLDDPDHAKLRTKTGRLT